MSDSSHQAFIDAPVEVVWDLVSDVNRHPEWWPRIVDVECEGLDEGCTYREVVKTPIGTEEMAMTVDQLEDCEALSIRCLNTGTYVRFLLTEAQGGTFLDGRMGMDPQDRTTRVFDVIAGKRFFSSWLRQTLESLGDAARRRAAERAEA